jgi:RNA polymerase sigma-70 factor (ECF subfamily)
MIDQNIVEKNKILISKLQEGNEKVWRELVNKYSDKLFGYALSLSFDHSIASDIVQQVFISFYEYRFKQIINKITRTILFYFRTTIK